jgi:hypothetical protein
MFIRNVVGVGMTLGAVFASVHEDYDYPEDM